MKPVTIISWVLRLAASLILLQTLYFKFTAHEESVYIFTTVGMEPWGRIGSGVMELIAGLMLLLPRTVIYGALLGVSIMSGAIISHLFILGIEVRGDGGQLFFMACAVMVSCSLLLYIHRKDLSILTHKVKSLIPL